MSMPVPEPVGSFVSKWGEGPLWHRNRLLYVDIEGHKVLSFDPVSGAEKLWEVGERVGTVVAREKGGLLIAGDHGFSFLDEASGSVTRITDPEAEIDTNRFNDGKCDPSGRFWAGTMHLGPNRTASGALYVLHHDFHVEKKFGPVTVSNGLVWTKDTRTMFYIDTPRKNVIAFDFDNNTGAISNERVAFVTDSYPGVPDGMAIDSEDRLWIAFCHGSAVRCFDQAGNCEAEILFPGPRSHRLRLRRAGFARSLYHHRNSCIGRGTIGWQTFCHAAGRKRCGLCGVRRLMSLSITRNSLLLPALLLAFPISLSRADSPAEAQRWAAACKTPPPSKYTEAVARLISRMQTEHLWEKCGLLLFFAAHESTPEAFNLKGANPAKMKFSGPVEHQPGRAIKGNGVDASLDTGIFPKDIPGFELQHHGLYVYVTDDVPGGFTAAGASGGGTAFGIRPRNLSSMGLYTGVAGQVTAGQFPSGVGFCGYSRLSETEGIWIKDKMSGALGFNAAAWPKSTLHVLRHGAQTAWFPGGVAFLYAGAPLDTNEGATLSGLFDECLKTLGTLDAIRVPPTPAYAGPGAFTREDAAKVKPQGMKIFALTSPPASDATTEKDYHLFPIDYAVCRPWTATGSTSTKVKCLELVCSDRALGPKPGVISDIPFKKGNDTCGIITIKKGTGRTEFDSYELAIGATLGRTAWSAGLKPFADERCMWEGKRMGWCDWLEMWGYDVGPWHALAKASKDVEHDPVFTTDMNVNTGGSIAHRAWVVANAEQIFTKPAFTGGTIFAKRNLVILGQGRAYDDPKFAGFLMDLEHADGRSPELFARSMEMWAHIIHSIKNPDGSRRFLASCSAHHLDGGTGKLAGWDPSTAHRVYEALDYTCINAGGAGPDVAGRVEAQLKVLRGPNGDLPVDLHKIMVQSLVGIGRDQMKMDHARALRDWVQSHPDIGAIFLAAVGANWKAPLSDPVSQLRGTIYGLISE